MMVLTAVGFLLVAYAILRSFIAWTKGDHYYQAVPLGAIGLMFVIVGTFPNSPVTLSVMIVLSIMLLTILLYTAYKFFCSLLFGDIKWGYLMAAVFSIIMLTLLFLKGIFM